MDTAKTLERDSVVCLCNYRWCVYVFFVLLYGRSEDFRGAGGLARSKGMKDSIVV